MTFLPEEYPTGLTDVELIKIIDNCSIQATRAGRPNSGISAGVSYWKEMAELGQNEINNRVQINLLLEINKLKDEIILFKVENEKSGRLNKKLNYITIGLAILTGILAIVSLNISWPEKVKGKSILILQLESENIQKDLLKTIDKKLDTLHFYQPIQLRKKQIIK